MLSCEPSNMVCKNVNICIPKSHLYCDFRRPDKEGRGCVRIVISRHGKRAMISLGIYLHPNQWKNNEVINHPDKNKLNMLIQFQKVNVDQALLQLNINGELSGKMPKDIIPLINECLHPEIKEERIHREAKEALQKRSFVNHFNSYFEKIPNRGTKGLYTSTLKIINLFCTEKHYSLETTSFDDINKSWLESFESYCLQTERQNTVAIHLRNIRAVFNAAIDEGITTNYPFRRFKIKTEESRDKSYTAKELRALFSYKCYPGGEQEAVEIFMLMFCLIGINSVDLSNLRSPVKGRVEYYRAKTHKLYSIKVEPEAERIIKKYKGQKHALNIIERCPNYKTYFNRMGKSLRKVGKKRVCGHKSLGDAILPDICTGSARTSWATIAQSELDIPRDVIAAALGHHTIDVTTTYLRTAWEKKIDEANRKVLDWVFYGKK